MPRIIADHNIEGHLKVLVRIAQAGPWAEVWREIGVETVSFENLGLSADAPDADLWEACQKHQVVLITANRNQSGPDSLEATIARSNQASSLPVFTVSDADQILTSRKYAIRVVP